MIGAQEISLMKTTTILINTSRGGIVDETSLVSALDSHKLAAAGLDVFEDEPLALDNPILGLSNVVLTPHTGGPTWDHWPKAFRNAFDNIQRVAAGHRPYWVIPELSDIVK
jgi:phosphoglycerate dehydrogenase-like enzyme